MKRGIEVGTRVLVNGYPFRIFEVISIKEVSEYLNRKMIIEVRYKLKDIYNGEEIIGINDDVSIYTDKTEYEHTVDKMLDDYIDCITLFQIFNDSKYKDRATKVLNSLKEYVEHHGRKNK